MLITKNFQDSHQPTYSKRTAIGEFKVMKGRKCNAPAAEFVVKMSNRFDILMEEEEPKNSSSKEVIKSSKPVVQRNTESTNVKQMKALKLTKHSSSRSSKIFGQVSDKKQGVFNQSITNWAVQSSRSKDCVGVNKVVPGSTFT